MTYSESAKGITITRQRALQELKDHGVIEVEDFYNDLGRKDTYLASEVLEWLGY